MSLLQSADLAANKDFLMEKDEGRVQEYIYTIV
jgi:hypothetical protein